MEMKQRIFFLAIVFCGFFAGIPPVLAQQGISAQQAITEMDQIVSRAKDYGQKMQRYYYGQPGDAGFKDFAMSTIQSACINRAPDKSQLNVADYVRNSLRYAWGCYNAVDSIGSTPSDFADDDNVNAALPAMPQNQVSQSAVSRRAEIQQAYQRYKQLFAETP